MLSQILAHVFRCILTMVSPKLNTMITYRVKFGKRLDFNNPRTLNEKILWLKFNDYWNNDLIKQCADKYRVREYVESIGCKEILNDLIAVYHSVDEIEWDALPNSFVIKLNVGCGFNHIVTDYSSENKKDLENEVKQWLKKSKHQWMAYSELQYKNIKPVIIVEKYLKPQTGILPEDYKFYCFDGAAPYVMVCTDRQEGGKHPRYWYYNDKWELQMLSADALEYGMEAAIPKPDGIDDAFEYAKKLSRGFPFVRVDLYLLDGKIYFGELTFTPSGGQDNGRLPKADELLGRYVDRPKKLNENR